MTNENKHIAYVRLLGDEDPKIIAADLSVPYATILRWKAEVNLAQENDTVAQLIKLSANALDTIMATAKADLPDELSDIFDKEVKQIIAGAGGLQKLEVGLQDTAIFINSRISALSAIAVTVSEITELTDALCKLQSAFFGKGTIVQVNNQFNHGASTYANLRDTPGTIDHS